MRILTIGALTFIAWSTLSTYLYVCNIKGLCNESVIMPMSDMNAENTIVTDAVRNLKVEEQLAIPKDLVIYFAFDKSEFSSNSITDHYFGEANAYLSQNKLAIMNITGHTDAVGTLDYNQSLGYRRAQSLQHYFKTKGMNDALITIASKGEREPADKNNTTNGRANNRRTVITIKK